MSDGLTHRQRTALRNLKENQDDYYSTVLFHTFIRLFPEKDPHAVRLAIQNGYNQADKEP